MAINQMKILSKKTKYIVSEDIKHNIYNDRENANESAYMMSSVDLSKYSLVSNTGPCCTHQKQWCSCCYDFREILVLYAGCRIGLCTAGENSLKDCIIWDLSIHEDNFVFWCPYCIKSWKVPCLMSA